MNKNFFIAGISGAIIFAAVLHTNVSAQIVITSVGTPESIDFTGFDGSGFTPAPDDGQLSSNTWEVTGFSDGNVLFGDEGTTGDFARGTTIGGETEGGIYAATYGGDVALMLQPVDDDFTPGSLTLRIKNGSGTEIEQLDIDYLLYNFNDQDRSSSLNFSYSNDNISFTDVPSLNYTSPETGDFSLFFEFKNASLTGISIPDGEVFYLRWTGDDVSGSGSRDEFALDLIYVTAVDPGDIPAVSFSTDAITVNESDLSADFAIQISSSSDCSANISVGAASTASDGTDYSFSLVSPVVFLSGGDMIQFQSMDLLEDTEDEADETLIIEIDDVTGTCEIGTSSTITITIIDNDETVIPAVDIIDVHGENGNGICTSIGELVSITGIVYGINLSDDGLEFTLIDETAGISVFNAAEDFGYTVTEGDELNVIGTIAQFNGLTQIIPNNLSVLSSGNALESPVDVSDLDESTESDLVVTNSYWIVDPAQWLGDGSTFNVEMINTVNSTIIIMRIDNNTDISNMPPPPPNQIAPAFITITGLGTQADVSSP
ncbi:MAG: hypothetical protein H7Y00_04920, partial [Fimbriimonadaceae bacterium]|nr:hypothetical protein [Chitinophagales bacterium]